MKDTSMDAEDKNSTRLKSIIESPIFIVGCPRSGTTWLQRLLLSHEDICGGQETHFFSIFGVILKHYKYQQESHRKVGLPCYWEEEVLRERIIQLWHETIRNLVEKSPEVKYVLEKTPDHGRFIDVIVEMLPNARFIHIIRDSRAVVSSLLAANRSEWGKWAPKTAKQASALWHLNVQNTRKFGSQLPPSQYYELKYEDLKSDSLDQLRKIFEFLNITVDEPELLKFLSEQNFEKQSESGGTPLAIIKSATSNLKEPDGFFRKGELASWKNDLNLYEKAVVWRYTRKLMRDCGYSI